MLDYGIRSRCCSAPIRFGFKRVKKSRERKAILICTKCGSRDINILTKEELKNQT